MAGWPGILSLSWATTKLVSVIPNLESRGETSTRATARTSDEPRSVSFSTTWFTILKGDFFPASFAPLAVSGAHLHGRWWPLGSAPEPEVGVRLTVPRMNNLSKYICGSRLVVVVPENSYALKYPQEGEEKCQTWLGQQCHFENVILIEPRKLARTRRWAWPRVVTTATKALWGGTIYITLHRHRFCRPWHNDIDLPATMVIAQI